MVSLAIIVRTHLGGILCLAAIFFLEIFRVFLLGMLRLIAQVRLQLTGELSQVYLKKDQCYK